MEEHNSHLMYVVTFSMNPKSRKQVPVVVVVVGAPVAVGT